MENYESQRKLYMQWTAAAITPDLATITFSKKGEGVAWGGLYWQYFEDLDKITPAETQLKTYQKDLCRDEPTAVNC